MPDDAASLPQRPIFPSRGPVSAEGNLDPHVAASVEPLDLAAYQVFHDNKDRLSPRVTILSPAEIDEDDTLGDAPISFGKIIHGRMAYTDDALQYAAEVMFQAAGPLGTKKITDKGEDGERCRIAYVESIARALGMESDGKRRVRERSASASTIPSYAALKATIDELQGVVGRQAAEIDRLFRRAAEAERLRSILRPLRIDELIEKRNATECGVLDDPAEEAEVALWAEDQRGRAIRFVAELATMTDIEADFLDGSELRQIARLLQIPGEDAPAIPRLYSEEDRKRASSALQAAEYRTGVKFEEMVDAVAEALGMRRAGA